MFAYDKLLLIWHIKSKCQVHLHIRRVGQSINWYSSSNSGKKD